MVTVHFPEPTFNIKNEKGKEYIFDTIRKKWVVLTPEEWVRQNFIQWLVQVNKYPNGFISVEKEIQFGELKKRFDVLVYNHHHEPWLMVECKSMEVPLTEGVLHQILRYNSRLPVRYLVITNAHQCRAWMIAEGQLTELDQLPAFSA
jgi:hypothetical protein